MPKHLRTILQNYWVRPTSPGRVLYELPWQRAERYKTLMQWFWCSHQVVLIPGIRTLVNLYQSIPSDNEAPPVGDSKWFVHLPIRGGGVGGGSWNLMLSSNLLQSKIPILWGGRRGSRNLMLSSNLLKSKIPILWGGGGGLVEPISNFWCWVQIC